MVIKISVNKKKKKKNRNTLIRIKANVYITEVFNYSHGTSLVHQRGRRSIVLEHSVFSMVYAMWVQFNRQNILEWIYH